MPCPYLKTRASARNSGEPPPPVLSVLILLEYKGSAPGQAIYGEVTNTRYPFDRRRAYFVDTRDAVFLLGPDYK